MRTVAAALLLVLCCLVPAGAETTTITGEGVPVLGTPPAAPTSTDTTWTLPALNDDPAKAKFVQNAQALAQVYATAQSKFPFAVLNWLDIQVNAIATMPPPSAQLPIKLLVGTELTDVTVTIPQSIMDVLPTVRQFLGYFFWCLASLWLVRRFLGF